MHILETNMPDRLVEMIFTDQETFQNELKNYFETDIRELRKNANEEGRAYDPTDRTRRGLISV